MIRRPQLADAATLLQQSSSLRTRTSSTQRSLSTGSGGQRAEPDSFTDMVPTPHAKPAQLYLANGPQERGSYWPGATQAAIAGQPFEVNYQRTLSEFGTSEKLRSAKFHYSLNGKGYEIDMPVTMHGDLSGSRVKLDLPEDARGDLAFWIEGTTVSGATVWDSQNGKNFHAPVIAHASSTVAFDEQWSEAVTGPIVEGQSFQIAYDVDRLRNFLGDGWYRMGNTFGVSAYVSFDGGPARQYRLTNWVQDVQNGGSNSTIDVEMPTVQVPMGAKNVKIWFQASTIGGSMFDSEFGRNYSYDVQPA